MQFLGQRFLHFLMYLILALLTVGVPYKLFFKDTSKTVIGSGGKQIIIEDEGLQPTFGCATGRQFIGWAHQKKEHRKNEQ